MAQTKLWLLAAMAVAARPADVRSVAIPGGGVAPDAAVDSKGVTHIVFGRGSDAYYTRSTDNGKTLSAPLRINTTDSNAGIGRERGPKLALGKGDSVHVAWIGPRGKGAWYTRLDGAKFAAERDLNDGGKPVDGVTVATDARGRVMVFWIDSRLPPEPSSPVSHHIFYALSEDNGANFADSRRMQSEYPGIACACCNLEAAGDAAGVVRLAFRGGYQALRDFQLVETRDGRNFTWQEVHKDGWKLEGCPMSGADLRPDFPGGPAVAWMSQGDVYYRIGKGPRLAPAAPKTVNRNYPLLLANKAGDRLLAWTEGMEIRWELTGADGKVRSGVEKNLTHQSRPGGFTGTDGNFYLIP
jgi:hypothetical protein